MSLLALGSLAAMSLMLSTVALEMENREAATETSDMRTVLEEIEGLPFEEVLARFNDDPTDDPAGNGPMTSYYEVDVDPQASPPPASAHVTTSHQLTPGRKLRIQVNLPLAADGSLTETDTSTMLGMPIDLNADGVIDGDDRTGDHKAVPMIVDVTVDGPDGQRRTIRVPRIRIKRRDD